MPRLPRIIAGAFALAATTAFSVPVLADPSRLPPEVGWNYNEMETPRSAALGGATRAISSSTTALFSNPANMVATQLYRIEGLAQLWPEAGRQSYGLGIVDSVSTKVAGGIAGNYTLQDGDGLGRKVSDIRLGFAFPLSDKFFLGATGKYLHVNQRYVGPFGPSYASGGTPGDPIVNQFNVDAGVTVKPIDRLAISAVGTNLTNPGHGFLPTTFGGGVGFGDRDFSLEADAVADFTTYRKTSLRVMGGGELLVADHVPLRLGYRYDDGQNSHAISGGLGYVDQQFGVEVGVRRTVAGDAATTIVIGLQVYIESITGVKTPSD